MTKTTFRAALAACLVSGFVLMSGCSAPGDAPKADAASAAATAAPADRAQPAEPAVQSAEPASADATPVSTTADDKPAEAEAQPEAPASVSLEPVVPAKEALGPSLSCRTSADCAVKDVGSCCGYKPSCVNKDSATFPDQVKAQCAQQGRVGICGFAEVSGCECVAGKCSNIASGDRELIQ